MNNVKVLVLTLLVASLVGCNSKQEESPTVGTIKFAVAESQVGLMQKELDEFHSLYPNARVEMVPTTSRGAIVLLLNDSMPFHLHRQGVECRGTGRGRKSGPYI